MRDDTISRAAALDFVSAMNFCDEISDEAYQKLTVHFENLPSATDTNVATTDTISKAAVVDAIEGVDWYHQNENGEMVHGANSAEHEAWYKAEDIYHVLDTLPSAQPTLYGYSIEFLAMVAEIMKKENVGPGEALQLFKSASYIAELVRAEWYENVQRQMEQMFAGGQDGTV